MRMRKKKNLPARVLNTKEFFIVDPMALKGVWGGDIFGGLPVALEIGCGKGSFLAQMAAKYPEKGFLGLERVAEVLVVSAERAKEQNLSNARFILGDADNLLLMFDKEEIDEIYLNFPDPWRKSRHFKRRLVYRAYLDKYLEILKPGGAFVFKTDNLPLFEFALDEIKETAFNLTKISYDLHPGGVDDSVMSDYERKFVEEGVKINMLFAVKK